MKDVNGPKNIKPALPHAQDLVDHFLPKDNVHELEREMESLEFQIAELNHVMTRDAQIYWQLKDKLADLCVQVGGHWYEGENFCEACGHANPAEFDYSEREYS